MSGCIDCLQTLKKDKTIMFITGNFSSGGAPKMLTFAVNQACRFFSEVHIVSFTKTKPYYQLDKKVVVHYMDSLAPQNPRIFRYFDRVRYIKKVADAVKPCVVFSFRTVEALYAKLGAPPNAIVVASERGNPEKKDLKYRIIARLIFRRCDLLIFQTSGVANFFGKQVQGKYRIIPNPFLIEGEDPGIYIGKREKRIVSVSRLSKEKNIPMLIKAYKKSIACGEYKLEIYGDGAERDKLESLVKKLKIENHICFMGETSNVAHEIYKASLYINASNSEGMPNSQIEAMGLGIPCIATKCMVGKSNPLIINGINGISVSVNDDKALANAINTIIANDELAFRLGREGARIREKLSSDEIKVLWNSLFRKILELATWKDRND